jgi:ParB family chromosome partitioning protein
MSRFKLTGISNELLGSFEDITISDISGPYYLLRDGLQGIDELASSIADVGLLHPITVAIDSNHKFKIVSGNRRYSACKRLGWKRIPCHLIEVNDKTAYEIALIENIQRRTLSPIEEARAYRQYVEQAGWGGMSELSKQIGKSVSHISRRISLLELPNDVLMLISDSLMTVGSAEELSSVASKEKQSKLAKLIATKGLPITKIRELKKEQNYSNDDYFSYMSQYNHNLPQLYLDFAIKSFDRSIIALKLAKSKLLSLIEKKEAHWLLREILLQHKGSLDNQIDILIKQKIKYKKQWYWFERN